MAFTSLLIAEKSLVERGFAAMLGLGFGAMGSLWLWLAIASFAGVVRNDAGESSIRADAIFVGTPFGTRRYRWSDVVGLTLHRDWLSSHCNLAVIVRSGLGLGTNTIRIYADQGITQDEFDQLYDQLIEQGLLPEDEEA
jgi:hypothetical protein